MIIANNNIKKEVFCFEKAFDKVHDLILKDFDKVLINKEDLQLKENFKVGNSFNEEYANDSKKENDNLKQTQNTPKNISNEDDDYMKESLLKVKINFFFLKYF